MHEEIKVLTACVKAIEKLPDGIARQRVVSYLTARYTAQGRMSIKLAAELAASLGDQQRARDVRHQLLDDLVDIDVGTLLSGSEEEDRG